MKKALLINLIIFYVLGINAQSLVVTGSSSISTQDPCLQSHASLTVKNVSSNTLNVLCEKVIVDTTAGTENFFCWGSCYGAATYLSTDYIELSSGQGDSFGFGGYYDAYCAAATATIEYCFFPETDINDRTCITITYNESTTSVKNGSSILLSEFYPNPANDVISVDCFLEKPSKLIIIDILGNQVKTIQLNGNGKKQINISDLSNGIYFANLMLNNETATIKKIVVN